MVRFILFILLIVAASPRVKAGEKDPAPVQLSAAQISNIERWAEVYEIPKAEALEQYRMLVGNDYPKEIKAVAFFAKWNAFEIAAAAQLEARDDNISAAMLDTLERKKDFSRTSFEAAMAELEMLNKAPVFIGGEYDEKNAGVEMVKYRLATLISKWIGIPDPDVIHTWHQVDTKPAYRTFIAQAKLKAQGMTGDSPF